MFIECYHKIHKDQEVKGFFNYHRCSELEEVAQYNVYEVLEDNYIEDIEYICIYAHGSRVFGNPRKDSDLDFVLFYKGTIKEDSLFNIFADEEIYIEHIKCDFNPIRIDGDSDMRYYIQKHDIEYYNEPILEGMTNLQLALDNFDDEELSPLKKSKQELNRDYTKEYLDLMEEVVDLGLPSGTLWCKYNLDVELEELKQGGERWGWYHAWGEMREKPWSYVNSWYDYDLCDKSKDSLKKYCAKDGLKVLQPEDDIVYEQTNGIFKIPSKADFQELFDNTTHEWEACFGLYGMWFYSKINGKGIFFPASGKYNPSHLDFKHVGYYWTSDISENDYSKAYMAKFTDNKTKLEPHERCDSITIRPVINKKKIY